MPVYRFSVVVKMLDPSDEEILSATDVLGDAGCIDASIRGHAEGLELLFERAGDSLQAAIHLAVTQIEEAGHEVIRIEMERDSIAA